MKTERKVLIISVSVIAAVALIFVACAIYIGDYYRADEGAIAVFAPSESISVTTLDDGAVAFEPQNAIAGLIFYPGGKVEHNAYQPLMAALARKGILCVLIEMPFNLAVFDINAADGVQEIYPQIESWYIGGHSLGGSMAAAYLSDHVEEYDGLILLGSYSTADLSKTELDVISIYGSEDKVLNREKYDENKANLPDDYIEVEIVGGCHAFFGMYGHQDGDGIPTVTREEQTTITAKEIAGLIAKEDD